MAPAKKAARSLTHSLTPLHSCALAALARGFRLRGGGTERRGGRSRGCPGDFSGSKRAKLEKRKKEDSRELLFPSFPLCGLSVTSTLSMQRNILLAAEELTKP